MAMQAKNVSVTLGGKTVLSQIDTSFPRGKCTLLYGGNGSGKSTLIKALAGVVNTSGGTVLLGGTPLDKFSRREIARRIAVLFQAPDAPPDMSVEELAFLGRFPHGDSASAGKIAVQRALRSAGAEHLALRQLGTLSGGERRKAFLARALAQEPEILLLDEPDAALDAQAKNELLHTLFALQRDRQLTVIMAAHDLNFALALAEHVCILERGRIFASGRTDRIITPENLQKISGIPFEVFAGKDKKFRILPDYDTFA